MNKNLSIKKHTNINNIKPLIHLEIVKKGKKNKNPHFNVKQVNSITTNTGCRTGNQILVFSTLSLQDDNGRLLPVPPPSLRRHSRRSPPPLPSKASIFLIPRRSLHRRASSLVAAGEEPRRRGRRRFPQRRGEVELDGHFSGSRWRLLEVFGYHGAVVACPFRRWP